MTTEKWSTLLEPKADTVKKKKVAQEPAETAVSSSQQEMSFSEPEDKAESQPTVFSVSQINSLLKGMIEKEFPLVWLRGEISNFTAHSSGHFYFSLKDSKAQIKANMFKGYNSKLKFRPAAGMEVIVRGRLSVYEPRGDYSITCEMMEPVGAGALQKAFEQLKEKLNAEGLFSKEHKQPLPSLPKHIGIVTSPTGAAIQDILNVLSRRYKTAQITLIPARVQGDGAAREVVRGIEQANKLGTFDVLIVGRGGGSIEDLWCFNEEIVARAIFASKIPIISAVGHEIDFTIADFVADVRAPTPSAAAEIVAKSASEITERISTLKMQLTRSMQRVIERRAISVINLQKRLVDPKRRLEDLALRCDELAQRLTQAWSRYKKEKEMQVKVLHSRLANPKNIIATKKLRRQALEQNLKRLITLHLERNKTKTTQAVAMLDSLSPLKVLSRGYSISFIKNTAIKSVSQVKEGQDITTRVNDGEIISTIKELKKN